MVSTHASRLPRPHQGGVRRARRSRLVCACKRARIEPCRVARHRGRTARPAGRVMARMKSYEELYPDGNDGTVAARFDDLVDVTGAANSTVGPGPVGLTDH